MPNAIDANLAFEKEVMPQVKELLRKHASHIIRVETATEEQDTKQATDLVLRVDSGMIGVRVRRLETMKDDTWRDLTIRTRSSGGGRTEVDKLTEGWGDWYFYGWTRGKRIAEYMLLDIHKIRSSGLLAALDQKRAIPNGDDTFFKTIGLQDLIKNGCVVVHTVDGYQGKLHFADKVIVMNQLATMQNAMQAIVQQIEPAQVKYG